MCNILEPGLSIPTLFPSTYLGLMLPNLFAYLKGKWREEEDPTSTSPTSLFSWLSWLVFCDEWQDSHCSGFFLYNSPCVVSVSNIILQYANIFFPGWIREGSPYFPSQRKVSLSIQHLYYLSLPLSQVDQERECIFSIGFMVAKCSSRVCWYITYEGISLGRNHLIAKLKKVYLGRWNKVTFDIGNVESLNKWDH